MVAKQKVLEYLKEVAGSIPAIKVPAETAFKKLPFFLQDNYSLRYITLMGRRFVLAAVKGGALEVTPNQLATHGKQLRDSLEAEVAFEFRELPAFIRQRLVQKGIAFIVPGTQMFLPFMMMDVRSKTRNVVHAIGNVEGPLSLPAQLILLYHLQRKSLADQTLGKLSGQFKYSAMTLSRAVVELTKRGICDAQREGVRKYLRFTGYGQNLWRKALPFLRSPVVGTKAVLFEKHNTARYLHAGITGLSDYTSLADDPIPTIALTEKEWKIALKNSGITELPYLDEQCVRVEIWGYDAKLLIEPGKTAVDRLSLYLSCKDNHDERVQIALENLQESVQWSKE